MLNKLPAKPLMTVFFGLLLSLIVSESILFSPPALSPAAVFTLALLKILPLLAFTPWLWRHDSASPMGLALVLLVYLCLAAVSAFLPGMAGHFAQLRCLLVAALITACLLVVRRPKPAAP
jgi:uncharacterized membrane protein